MEQSLAQDVVCGEEACANLEGKSRQREADSVRLSLFDQSHLRYLICARR